MGLLRDAGAVLQATPEELVAAETRLRKLALLLVGFGLVYGAAMGTFGGITSDRLSQILYSAVKVPILLAATFLISLPSFFIINTLFGLREDFGRALRVLLATQAVLTIVLASLAPFTLLWYRTSGHYQTAILFNALMFGIASISAQHLCNRGYRNLVSQNPAHRTMRRVWLLIYAFVGVQMAWVLRPFVGAPGTPTTFFRSEVWDNAYVYVARIIWDVLTG